MAGAGNIITQSLTPELLEPCRIGGRVLDGVLNVPMPEIVLNEPRIGSLVGKSKAAGVAQHVGMGEQRQGGGLAVCPQKQIDGRAVQRLAPLADKERLHARANLPPGAVFQPGADGAAARRRAAAASSITRLSAGAHARRGFRRPPGRASAGRPPTRAALLRWRNRE